MLARLLIGSSTTMSLPEVALLAGRATLTSIRSFELRLAHQSSEVTRSIYYPSMAAQL